MSTPEAAPEASIDTAVGLTISGMGLLSPYAPIVSFASRSSGFLRLVQTDYCGIRH